MDGMDNEVRVSDRVVMMKRYAAVLMGMGQAEDAERIYRRGLAEVPDDVEMLLGLSQAFQVQHKQSEAFVAVEAVLEGIEPPAQAFVRHAWLLLDAGEVRNAARQYAHALDLDPGAADESLLLAIEAAVPEDEEEGG